MFVLGVEKVRHLFKLGRELLQAAPRNFLGKEFLGHIALRERERAPIGEGMRREDYHAYLN